MVKSEKRIVMGLIAFHLKDNERRITMKRELQIVQNLGLNSGDRVITPKSSWNLVQHHALYLGCDDWGNHFMCENIINEGVRLTRVHEFFNGVEKVTRIEKFTGNQISRKSTVQKALARLGKPYNLINYNCESFCNEVVHGKSFSEQAKFGLGLGLLAMLFIVFSGSSKS